MRYPTDSNSTTHGLQALSNALNSGREGRNSLTLALLHSQPYGRLATVASDSLARGDITTFSSRAEGNGSLEGSIHGNYHNLIGGSGHMGTPILASFDPVFWFHHWYKNPSSCKQSGCSNNLHSQVDRLWAFWQAFHPKEWFPKPQVGQLAENHKDLLPFYKSRSGPGKGIFYSSDDSKATEPFGYVYDDFVGIDPSDIPALRKQIDNKYTWASRTPAHPNFTEPPSNMLPLKVRSTYFFSQETTNGSANFSRKAAKPTDSSTAHGSAVADSKAGESAGLASGFISSVQSTLESVPIKLQSVLATTSETSPKIDSTFDREWYVDSVVQR